MRDLACEEDQADESEGPPQISDGASELYLPMENTGVLLRWSFPSSREDSGRRIGKSREYKERVTDE